MQIGPHRCRHADPADGKAREPDEHQKGAQPFDETRHARRAVARVGPAHPGIGKTRFGLGFERGEGGALGQFETVFAVEKRAGGKQAGAFECRAFDQCAGPKGKAAGGGIRFAFDQRGQGELRLAKCESVTGGEGQPIRQCPFHHRAGQGGGLGRKGIFQRQGGVQDHLADQRIEVIDRLDLRERAF